MKMSKYEGINPFKNKWIQKYVTNFILGKSLKDYMVYLCDKKNKTLIKDTNPVGSFKFFSHFGNFDAF